MDITGILIKKLSEREGTSESTSVNWKIAEFLMEIPGQYPRRIMFSVSDGQQGRILRFESLIGKTVTVSFDIDAHEWQGRWFNKVIAWGIMEYAVGHRTPQTHVAQPSSQEQTQDDLPFPPAEGDAQ